MPRSRKSVLVSCCAALTVLIMGAAAKADAPAVPDAGMDTLPASEVNASQTPSKAA